MLALLSETMQVTIGYTSHSMETIPASKRIMEAHDLIITEEAPAPGFTLMLNKKIPIRTYIEEEHLEFPRFSKRYFVLLRVLYGDGKKILQVEPYIERLLKIYAMFSDGKNPSDVEKIPALREVYAAEKRATAALLTFYERSISGPFPSVIESVRRFAKADAEKFRLRDSLRAHSIAEVVRKERKRIFVETGSIHVYLERVLRRKLKQLCRIETVNLLEDHIRYLTGRSTFFPPGDILTLHYILRRKERRDYESLLAAQSILYSKLLKKEEILPSRKSRAPHLEDKIGITALVGNLTVEKCEELFSRIRFLTREKALEIVKEHTHSA
ncbi:MAG: hypothetical protein ACOYVJ_02835 [Nitrospirota bacterium]